MIKFVFDNLNHDIYKAIIESSQRSRQSINIAVGMG